MVGKTASGAFAVEEVGGAFMEAEIAIEAALHRCAKYVPLADHEVLVIREREAFRDGVKTLIIVALPNYGVVLPAHECGASGLALGIISKVGKTQSTACQCV